MTPRYDAPASGGQDEGDLLLLGDVQASLERAARLHPVPPLDPHEHWARGRRRRARKRAGAGVLACAATVTALALGWQAGLLGGARAPVPTVSALPDGYTTFVFAAPDAGPRPAGDGATDVPTAAELTGTSWELQDRLWQREGTAASVVGADPGETVLRFADSGADGWGFVTDDCGGGWFEDDLVLDGAGRFAGGGMGTDDLGCPPDAQAAEDFWIDVLSRGGYLRSPGDGWLLVSVVTPTGSTTDAGQATDVVTGTGEPTAAPTAAPTAGTPQPTPGPTTPPTSTPTPTSPTAAPVVPTSLTPRPTPAPTTTAAPAPTTTSPAAAPAPPATTPPPPTTDAAIPPGDDGSAPPSAPAAAPLPGFVPAGSTTASEGWPGSGGDLLAPTVRAGRNDGFDRVVLDLTGTSTPTWRAAYTDEPVRDGSGLPAQVAGDRVLELVVTGMTYPEPGDPVYDDGDFGLDTHTLDGVVEVIRTTPFEGQLQLFVGVTGEPRPYRVFVLEEPLRLVVDVQHVG